MATLVNSPLGLAAATRIDPTLAELLPGKPRSLQEYIADHQALWTA